MAFDSGGIGASPEVIAALLKPLGDAQSNLAEGVGKGKGTCDNAAARNEFRKAAKDMRKFQERVIALCGADSSLSQTLLGFADMIKRGIDELVAGNCGTPLSAD